VQTARFLIQEAREFIMKNVLRILNLEDSETDAALNHAMLAARWPDCELVRVDKREDFIAALERGGFDVILSDYTMPGFNGREALALAHAKRPATPFLFMSGTIGEDTAIEALKNGATDYVLKHRPIRLIPSVDRALREARERAEYERAEQSMHESEHKYRTLFECLGDAAFLVDEQTEKILDVNRRAEQMLGCTRAEILGRKHPQFLALALAPAPVFETKMIRANGFAVPVEVRVTRLTLYDRALLLRLCHELTGRDSG
jgi:PAS domain S-box-containing protein